MTVLRRKEDLVIAEGGILLKPDHIVKKILTPKLNSIIKDKLSRSNIKRTVIVSDVSFEDALEQARKHTNARITGQAYNKKKKKFVVFVEVKV